MRYSKSRGMVTPRWPFSGSGPLGFVPHALEEAGTDEAAATDFQTAIVVRQQARVTAARPKWSMTMPSSSSGGSDTPSGASTMATPTSMTPGTSTTSDEAGEGPGEGETGTAGDTPAAEVQTMSDGAGAGPTVAQDEIALDEHAGGTELGVEAGVGTEEEEKGSRWPIYVGAGLGVLALVGVGLAIWGGSKKR